MNDTQHAPPAAGPDDEFDPQRLRTITDMKRSTDDRVVAGVCAGAARYLNIDPVIVRVVLAVLTLAGFAGLILYLAAWLFLPADNQGQSVAADWFNLDKNEEQVRVAGLVVAAVIAALSVVGDSSWAWWGDAPWWIVPFALVAYVFWIRPRRRREARARQDAAHGVAPSPYGTPGTAPTTTKRGSAALLALTTSVALIALAALRIYDETQDNVPWTAYIATALAVVGVGLLVGTFFGNGGPLIAIGIILAVALAVGSALPNCRIGTQRPSPTVAADVDTTYRHGLGQLELDLTQVTDPQRLEGRTISLDLGVGQTRVIVPDGLNVTVDTHLDAGEVSLFGRTDDGSDVSMADLADQPGSKALSIRIDQKLGQIEVISR